MSKAITFTQVECDILQKYLAERIQCNKERYPDFFDNPKSKTYKNQMLSVETALEKIKLSDTCELLKWEKLACNSVINGEYHSQLKDEKSLHFEYNRDIHRSIIVKCKVFSRR